MPWMNLKNMSIWISEGDSIKEYKRQKSNFISNNPTFQINGKSKEDVVKFVNRNNYLLAGQR